MPAPALPETMRRGRFPPGCLVDAEVPLRSSSDIARANGTLAALPPEVRTRYHQAKRQLS